MTNTAWIFAAALACGLIGLALSLVWRGATMTRRGVDLPDDWPLAQRPLFTLPEREMYCRLRSALPHHIVLAKVPLVRFSQPLDHKEQAYWFNLLGPLHVSFIVCADNGRVLAAVDVERHDRNSSRRATTIKQAVLATCRIRYLKCHEDQLATPAELQLLVPPQADHGRSAPPRAASTARDSRATLAHAVRARRGEHHVQWYESGYNHDSFFAPDSLGESSRDHGGAGGHLGPAPVHTDLDEDEAMRPDPGTGVGNWQIPDQHRQQPPVGRHAAFVFDEQQLAYRRR
ncbi:MAG: hypothetical protein RLZZ584_2194 [Pseudomonadota bacterium]|jgi:hypothetical protein